MKNGQQRIAKVLCVLLDGAFMVGADLLGLCLWRFELLVPAEEPGCLRKKLGGYCAFEIACAWALWDVPEALEICERAGSRGGGIWWLALGIWAPLTLASFVPQMAWPRGAMLISYLLAMCFVGLSRFYLRIKVELARVLRWARRK